MSWYLLSIVALLLLGFQRFLYKVAAEKKCSSAITTAVFMATVTLLSSAVYFAGEEHTEHFSNLMFLALLNSSAFALATISNIEALKRLPAGIIFPLTRMSLVLVILASVFIFDETLEPIQWFGIVLGFTVIAILIRDASSEPCQQADLKVGALYICLGIICGAIASVSSKLAAESVSKAGFMAMSYLVGMIFSLGIELKWGRRVPGDSFKDAILLGVLMGMMNFFGFYAFLCALASGPLSVIALITGMHFMIAILFSALIYHEKLTFNRSLGIGLMLVAVILLK